MVSLIRAMCSYWQKRAQPSEQKGRRKKDVAVRMTLGAEWWMNPATMLLLFACNWTLTKKGQNMCSKMEYRYFWNMLFVATSCSSVHKYQTTQRHNLEDCDLDIRRKNLIYCVFSLISLLRKSKRRLMKSPCYLSVYRSVCLCIDLCLCIPRTFCKEACEITLLSVCLCPPHP
jgi:hypothetical protein